MITLRSASRTAVGLVVLLGVFASSQADAACARPDAEVDSLVATSVGGERDDDSGMGGTGLIGTITGFGSICVNGHAVEFDDETPTEVDGEAGSAKGLAVGQVVEIAAVTRDGALVAERIAVRHLVRAALERVDVAERQLVLLGLHVQLAAQARLHDGERDRELELSELQPGEWLALSGHWRPAPTDSGDVTLVASRVERIAHTAQSEASAHLLGDLRRRDDGTFAIGSVAIDVSPELRSASGERARVTVGGRWDPATGRVIAETLRPVVPALRDVARLSLEGFALPSEEPGRVRVSGVDVDLRAMPTQPRFDERIIVRGSLRRGVLRAERFRLAQRPRRLSPGRPVTPPPRPPQLKRPPRVDTIRPPAPTRSRPDAVRRALPEAVRVPSSTGAKPR